MTIWAFLDPRGCSPRIYEYVASALRKGESRFGWGGAGSDLRALEKPWAEMTKDEKQTWRRVKFLLAIQQGDWVVHVNIPSKGKCTTAQVSGEYRFDLNPEIGDFGHCLPIDCATKVEFDRNDSSIHPRVTRSLKPRKRYQRVRYAQEFLDSMIRVKTGGIKLNEGQPKELFYLREEMLDPLQGIAKLIHRNHPSKALEYLVCRIFEKIRNVTSAKVNGSGWGTDHGADVIVHYETGLPFEDLRKAQILVVQVKSYDFKLHGRLAIDQLQTAIEKFKANAGMIICTAEPTDEFQADFDKFSEKSEADGVQVSLIAGRAVAEFVLIHGCDLLFDSP